MELVKDIYFNTDKLVENTTVKVSYTGKFYQGNNDKVFLHYGYGKDWNNVNEIEMAKTDLGYQAELNLQGKDTINFCFKNQNNEWDNNFGQNYIFDIDGNTSGIIEDVANNTPNSIDAIISNNSVNETFNNKFEISEIPAINNAAKLEELTICEEIINPINNKQENAIALAPTGFNYWTKKIKETVSKFFAYVPKLISGNYKRNLSNNKNN